MGKSKMNMPGSIESCFGSAINGGYGYFYNPHEVKPKNFLNPIELGMNLQLISSAFSNANDKPVDTEKSEKNAQKSIHKKIRALHIEDDDEIRFLVKAFLKNYIDVDPAVDGDDAILHSSTTRYDLIITDINLGIGIDGIQASRQIRNMSYYRDVPIIAATANGTSQVRNQCMDVGMDAFLLKPFMKQDLISTIEQVLENRS